MERRDSLGPVGFCGPPAVGSERGLQQLWVSGEVQRVVWAVRRAVLRSHGNSI